MATSVTYEFNASIRESVASDGADTLTFMLKGFNVSKSLSATSSPATSKSSCDSIALASGAATINLAALVGINGVAVDGTGLKVRLIRITNNGAAVMTFSEGASNGYALCGASWSHKVNPGCTWQQDFLDTAPAVASGDRTIDVAGTGTDSFDLTMVLG